MLIGHLPVGYIVTKGLQRKLRFHRYRWVGLLASILPDLDIIYFYLFDARQHLHHSYWTHIPFYWFALAAIFFTGCALLRKTDWMKVGTLFFINIFFHLLADTIVGKIQWLYPFSSVSYAFFEVPARYSWWIWNFVFHWTFLFEIIVIIWAVLLLINRRTKAASIS